MSAFYVRPELNGGQDNDWNLLHAEMYSRQFYRVILVDNIWYDLPTGLYFKLGNYERSTIYTQVVSALNAIGKTNTTTRRDYELIVIQNAGATFDLVRNTDKSKLPPNS